MGYRVAAVEWEETEGAVPRLRLRIERGRIRGYQCSGCGGHTWHVRDATTRTCEDLPWATYRVTLAYRQRRLVVSAVRDPQRTRRLRRRARADHPSAAAAHRVGLSVGADQSRWCPESCGKTEGVRSRMPRLPQPVPPIFQPEVAADAIVWAATHRRRELYVGWPTVKAIWGLRSPHGHGHAVQDYRYTWLRDAAFVLYASQAIGYHEETFRFFDRLEALFDAAHLQVLRREHDLRLRRLPGAIPWYAKMKQPQ